MKNPRTETIRVALKSDNGRRIGCAYQKWKHFSHNLRSALDEHNGNEDHRDKDNNTADRRAGCFDGLHVPPHSVIFNFGATVLGDNIYQLSASLKHPAGEVSMTDTVHSKLDIAYEYLETAMQLYIEETNYFSAILLAATAEELFGRHLPKAERMSSITLKAQIALQVLNAGEEIEYDAAQDTKGNEYKKAKKIVLGSKNEIKHMSDDGSNTTVTINPISEAREWIEYALSNFKKVCERQGYRRHLCKSPTMWKFEDYRAREVERLGRPLAR